MIDKMKELLDELYRSTLAADPTEQDILIKDLHNQVRIIRYLFKEIAEQALNKKS